MVPSTTMTSRDRQSTIRVYQRRGYGAAVAPGLTGVSVTGVVIGGLHLHICRATLVVIK
jgi:hypothetical protein